MPHPTRKTGRLPAIPGRPALRFGDHLRSVPGHPITDASPDLDFPMDGNDDWSDCVVAAVDHALQVIYMLLTGGYTNWSTSNIVDQYRTQNPNFDPANYRPEDDGGMVIQFFLEHLVKTGVILGFGKVDFHNAEELEAAQYLGLGLVYGVVVQQAQLDQQFDNGEWDYDPASPDDGGHAVAGTGYLAYGATMTADRDLSLTGGYNEATLDAAEKARVKFGYLDLTATYPQLVSWAKLLEMTMNYLMHQGEECWFLITQAHVEHPSFREHYHLASFAAAFETLTGKRFPVAIDPPAPAPVGGGVSFLVEDPEILPHIARAVARRPWDGNHNGWLTHVLAHHFRLTDDGG